MSTYIKVVTYYINMEYNTVFNILNNTSTFYMHREHRLHVPVSV